MSAAPKTDIAPLPITPEEYLARERLADTKSEYYDGEIFAMAGASLEHVRISTNVVIDLGRQLLGSPCEAFTSDLKVRANEMTYAYPDVTVVCGEAQFADAETGVLLNPTLIVEVLSPNTEAWDREGKFERYRERASLRECLLIAQERPHVEYYARQPDGQWLLAVATGLQEVLALASIGCELTLARVYHKVTFSETADRGT